MHLTLYNHAERQAFEPCDSTGEFNHTRGGSADSTWLRNESLDRPFDLLFTLDLGDPRVGLRIPGISRFPLLYGTSYIEYCGEQSYRVISDDTVQIFNARHLKPNAGDSQDATTAEKPIDFANVEIDLSRAEDALRMLQVFGLGDLNESELQRALDIAYSDDYNLDVIEDWITYQESTRQEYLEFWGSQPFWQPGGVSDTCNASKCSSERYEPTVRVIAQCQVDNLLVIFRYCSVCNTVFTLNQA